MIGSMGTICISLWLMTVVVDGNAVDISIVVGKFRQKTRSEEDPYIKAPDASVPVWTG